MAKKLKKIWQKRLLEPPLQQGQVEQPELKPQVENNDARPIYVDNTYKYFPSKGSPSPHFLSSVVSNDQSADMQMILFPDRPSLKLSRLTLSRSTIKNQEFTSSGIITTGQLVMIYQHYLILISIQVQKSFKIRLPSFRNSVQSHELTQSCSRKDADSNSELVVEIKFQLQSGSIEHQIKQSTCYLRSSMSIQAHREAGQVPSAVSRPASSYSTHFSIIINQVSNKIMQIAKNTHQRISSLIIDRNTSDQMIEQAEKLYRLEKNQLKLITSTFILDYFQKQQIYLQQKLIENPEKWSGEEENWAPNQLKIFTLGLLSYAHVQQKSLVEFNEKDIQAICTLFPNKSLNFIKYHHLYICKSATRQSRCEWKTEEIQMLTQIIQSHCFEKKWSDIAFQLYCRSALTFFKTSHQCREKWFNHLNPGLSKEKWTIEQDIVLFKNARDLGTKWAKISKAMGQNRTEHMIKNRFKSIAKKYENRFQRCTFRKKIENILKDLEQKCLNMKQKNYKQADEISSKEDPSIQSQAKVTESMETIKQEEAEVEANQNIQPKQQKIQQNPPPTPPTFNKLPCNSFEPIQYEYAQQKYDFVYSEGAILNLNQKNTHADIMLIDYLNIDFETKNKTIFSGSVQ